MIYFVLILVFVNIFAGEFSWRGRRLTMSAHPVMVRMRYFAYGLVAALFATGYQWRDDSALSWVAILLLAVTVARFPVPVKKSAPVI